MSFYDLISMSLGNLWRRKLRTFLTILGVLIGTSSIVAMLSLALGMKTMLMEEYSSLGSANQIQVTAGESEGMSSNAQDMDTILSDSNMEMFQGMEYVKSVTPSLSFDANIKVGKYQGYVELKGVSHDIIEEQEVGEGSIPPEGGSELRLLMGNQILTNLSYSVGDQFYDYYTTGELPDVDLMTQVRQVSYYDYASEGENQTEQAPEENIYDGGGEKDDESVDVNEPAQAPETVNDGQITMRVNVDGIMAGGVEEYGQYSFAALVDIDALKAYLVKHFGKDHIPGQPRKNGKPLKEWVYSSLALEVDDAAHVEEVMQTVQDMGFTAQSNKELLESMQKSLQVVELVLGGIGMVAFLVAAIGIANTMMMSTYERTKEIGVMKVLGCDMRDIQKLFLMEAGVIGFIGGIVGLGFTCILSVFINMAARSAGEGMTGNISTITWWLALVAVVFSTLMGMLAGYFPARRAMKLSPLAAIRTE